LPLAALIAAQEQAETRGGLRATMPLAGRTLVELQARLAAAAGASHIVLLVERVPAELAQAAERLRREGFGVEIVRSIAEAVERFRSDDTVLMIADGCVAGDEAVVRLAEARAPALLVLPDSKEQAMFERIDAEARWAGFALVGNAELAATAAMLGDWDFISTLLRRAVQADAIRIDALAPGSDGSPGRQPVLALDRSALAPMEQALLRRPLPGKTWVSHYLHRLITAPLIGPLVARKVQPLPIAAASVVVAWLAVLPASIGYFWVVALMLPLATAAFALAQRVVGIWEPDLPYARWFVTARHVAALFCLGLLAAFLAKQGDWGWYLVAALLPTGLTLLEQLRPIEALAKLDERPLWLASGDAAIWLVPPVAILCGWAWMSAILALYSLASFGWRFAAASRRSSPAHVAQL
jgi:CheY-like chemotaxis protein